MTIYAQKNVYLGKGKKSAEYINQPAQQAEWGGSICNQNCLFCKTGATKNVSR